FPVGTIAPYQPLMSRYRACIATPLEKISSGKALKNCSVVRQDNFICLRVEYANDCICVTPVQAEHTERVVVSGFLDTEQLFIK
ncbi:MAG: hypothetical protein ABW092_11900, partial [Candidatus Thiodiazotropha sp.]